VGKIIWVASYPRSGNTWLRFLLGHLLAERIESSAQLLDLIPDVHRAINGGHLYGPVTTLIKTHWAWTPDLPLREDTVGALYILRNPLDVLISNLNYRFLKSGESFAGRPTGARLAFMQEWIDRFIAEGGDPRWIQLGMGTWERNVQSWTADRLPYPRLVLRYEDLKAETAPSLAAICRFLGIERGPAAVAAAIERSSFAALRRLEEQEIAERRPGVFWDAASAAAHAEGRRFVSRGEVGAAQSLLTERQRDAALARFGPLMRRFGYLPPQPGAP
jgi:hypothetical protein